MTLLDLKGIIDYNFDIADDEIDTSLYFELDEISDKYLGQIEVVKITHDYVVCRLTNFIRRFANFHPSAMRKYLESAYDDEAGKEYMIEQLTKQHKGEDITRDGGDAVYCFIKEDLYDFLTAEE